MQRAWDATYAEPTTIQNGLVGYQLGESYERYTYHRQQLVRLGAVRELHYKLVHIKVPTDESRDFNKLLLSTNRPSCIDFESPYPEASEAMELTVWCHTDDAGLWDQFIELHDVPDYRTRFMGEK